MTSDTAPYGTVNVSSQGSNYEGFRAFDDTSSFWQGQGPTNQWLSYGFINASVIKKFSLKANNSGSVVRVKNFKLQASNVADFSDAVDIGVYVQSQNNNVQVFECDNNTSYKYYRIFVLDTYGSSNYVSIDRLQFYGVDYSEREFAEGSTMKYLYDHGVELETISITGTGTKDDDYITLSAANAQASHTLDLTPYDLLRGKVGDHMSGTTALIAETTATANMTAANAPNNESLNVSSVNASLATGAKMTAAGVCDITELWLE